MDSKDRNAQITALFEREHRHLIRTVASRIHGGVDVAEDAASFAWAQMFRYGDPDHPQAFAWLVTTALREAWRLAADSTANATEIDVADFVAAPGSTVEDVAEADEALAGIAQLPERQAQVMHLMALGFSREDIAEALGWTLRTVDRQLSKARKRLREGR